MDHPTVQWRTPTPSTALTKKQWADGAAFDGSERLDFIRPTKISAKNWWSWLKIKELDPVLNPTWIPAGWGKLFFRPNLSFCLAVSASQNPRELFAREKPVREYSFTSGNTFARSYEFIFHKWNYSFCKPRNLLVIPQKCVSAFHSIHRKAPGGSNFELSSDLFRGGPWGEEKFAAWSLKEWRAVWRPRKSANTEFKMQGISQGKSIIIFFFGSY